MDHRQQIREISGKLTSMAGVTLRADTAQGLARTCREWAASATLWAPLGIVELFELCAEMCASGGAKGDDELWKGTLSALQAALFGLALGGTEAVALKCLSVARERLKTRLGDLEIPTVVPAQPVEQLLSSIGRLGEKIQQVVAGDAELALARAQVVDAARTVHSVSFAEICDAIGVVTSTPGARVESLKVPGVSLVLKQVAGTGAAVALRTVGASLWLEVEADFPVVQAPHVNSIVTLVERYQDVSGKPLTRLRLDVCLPSFRAYEVVSAGRKYLIPFEDVESVNEVAEVEDVSLASLLELAAVRNASLKKSFLRVKWRGGVYALSADSVASKPELFFAKHLVDAGAGYRGVASVARAADGTLIPVLDLHPWFESWHSRRRDFMEAGRCALFKISGRRYAVPLETVVSVGKLPSSAVMTGLIETDRGTFQVRDLKAALGVVGAAGGFYLALKSSRGVLAWSVDSIEKIQSLDAEKQFQAPAFGQSAQTRRLVMAVFSGESKGAPISLLDVEQLGGWLAPVRHKTV